MERGMGSAGDLHKAARPKGVPPPTRRPANPSHEGARTEHTSDSSERHWPSRPSSAAAAGGTPLRHGRGHSAGGAGWAGAGNWRAAAGWTQGTGWVRTAPGAAGKDRASPPHTAQGAAEGGVARRGRQRPF